ncbi:MAG: energy transducer TonB [Gammaproteobacteria bacterium]|nr:energy transducer TonB [Gammaproteobacteria bacterium]
MRTREWVIWGSAVALSLSSHLALLINSPVARGEKLTPPSHTRISFHSVTAPITAPQEPPQQAIKQPVEEIIETPPPIITEPEPEPEPEPKPEPKPKPKPKPKERAKSAEKVRQHEPPITLPQPEPVTLPAPVNEIAQQSAELPEAANNPVNDPALLKEAKQAYLRRLMSHIETHKHYPTAARRRGIEGNVAVTFQLLLEGRVSSVKIDEGHHVLRKAVEEALAAAQPLPTPPATLKLPMEIAFIMQFSLQK